MCLSFLHTKILEIYPYRCILVTYSYYFAAYINIKKYPHCLNNCVLEPQYFAWQNIHIVFKTIEEIHNVYIYKRSHKTID